MTDCKVEAGREANLVREDEEMQEQFSVSRPAQICTDLSRCGEKFSVDLSDMSIESVSAILKQALQLDNIDNLLQHVKAAEEVTACPA